MAKNKNKLFVSVLITAVLIGWFGIRFLVPRLLFGPNDPALEDNDQIVEETLDPEDSVPDAPYDETNEVEGETVPEMFSFEDLDFEVAEMAENLEVPWEIIPLEDEDDWLIIQRNGEVLSLNKGQLFSINGVSAVGEGGLLGMALHPDFSSNRQIYFYYTMRKSAGLVNRVVRYEFRNDILSGETIIIDDIPGHSIHNGGRIAFGPDGYLYITTGDAGNTQLSQQTESLAGKILRITDTGGIPADNPFSGSPVYSYGHRNPQGLAWHPATGDLYASEHGPRSMDEVNLILPGRNYGWPVVTCEQAPTNYEDPVACYSEFTLAPSGMDFLDMEGLEGVHLLVAGLRGNQIRHLSLNENGLPMAQQPLFTEYGRIRSVRVYEGSLYFITNNLDGRGTPIATDDRMIRVTLHQ